MDAADPDAPKERSGLKFTHDEHLEVGGAVARMAKKLSAEYGYGEVLECADCHTADAGGALFETVRMEDACAGCHSLVFAEDGGRPRTLPHGEPEEVIAIIEDFFLASALRGVAEETAAIERRRPGAATRANREARRENAFAAAGERTLDAVKAVFSEGGACYDCHVVDAPEDPASLEYSVWPVVLADQFMPLARFHHDSHSTADLACETCHAAETSSAATDVLMPSIAECRECHLGTETKTAIPSDCVMCHVYHGDEDGHAPAMTPAGGWPAKQAMLPETGLPETGLKEASDTQTTATAEDADAGATVEDETRAPE